MRKFIIVLADGTLTGNGTLYENGTVFVSFATNTLGHQLPNITDLSLLLRNRNMNEMINFY
jgi:hypothetical protein